MSTRGRTGDDGVSHEVRESGLAALLDQPATETVRHYRSERMKRLLCSAPLGFEADHELAVTCETCLQILSERKAARAAVTQGRRTLRKVGAALRRTGS